MKKFFLFIASVFLFVSCTNEDVNSGAEYEGVKTLSRSSFPPVEDEYDQIMYDYVTSVEFSEYQDLSSKFSDKLFYKENYDKVHFDFSNETIFLNSVEISLPFTKFSSVAVMKAEWNKLQIASRKLYQANPLIKKVFVDNDLQVVKSYFDKWIFTNVILSDPDYDACFNSFMGCNDTADSMYLTAFLDAYNSSTGFETPSLISLADKEYQNNKKLCKYRFDKCIGL